MGQNALEPAGGFSHNDNVFEMRNILHPSLFQKALQLSETDKPPQRMPTPAPFIRRFQSWQKSLYKCLLLLAFTLSTALSSLAEGPTFRWSVRMGGNHEDFAADIAIDDKGNSYVVGTFRDIAYFDEDNARQMTSRGEADVFVAKLNRIGRVEWVNQIGGGSDDFARGITVDSAGNCVVTGSFQSPKAAIMVGKDATKVAEMLRQADSDIYVVKFATDGKLMWAKTGGSGPGGSGIDVATDLEGNVYVTGYFLGTGVFEDLTLNNSGYVDIFVARYDPAGELVWVRQIGGRSDDVATAIQVDAQGSIYLAGAFSEHMQVARDIVLKSEGLFDAFLIKLDSEGRTAWAVAEGGYMNDIAYGLGIDPAGNILLSGGYAGSESFGSEFRTHAGYRKPRRRYTRAYFGRTRLTSEGGSDIFVAKYNPAGKMVWVQSVGGNKKGAPEAGYGLDVDARGHAFVTGTFAGRVQFGNNTLISKGVGDIYVMELDRDGRVIWARQAGERYGAPSIGYNIAVDSRGSSYITGFIAGNVAFGDHIVKAYGMTDAFAAKVTAAFLP